MCGIIGLIGKTVNPEIFIGARDTMTSRGPDDAGVHLAPEQQLALGHRRLAIIDLTKNGAQPMVSHDGRYTVVFNGEIFNYLELKAELAPYYPFKTDSDTEVLLAAFAHAGLEGLRKLNGQFAFAIYDAKTDTLTCVRDHFGIKPFFYAKVDDTLYFASEIGALLALGVRARVNERALFEFLEYGLYDHRRETFFDGIHSIEPGTALIYEKGTIREHTYWDLAELSGVSNPAPSLSDAVDEFKTRFERALRLQFRADVPVGINMSSGLDSAGLNRFSRHIRINPTHLFTVGIDDNEYDERELVRDRLDENEQRAWHTSVLTKDDVWPILHTLTKQMCQPFGGMPTAQYYKLYEGAIAPAPVTVLLEGQGVDELLAGYTYYRPEHRHLRGRSQDATLESGHSLVDEAFRKRAGGPVPLFSAPFDDELMNLQYRDIRYTKLPRVLRFNDHVSMMFSKELRVPYLDVDLATFCFKLPEAIKLSGTTHKLLLREALGEYLPTGVSANKKRAFGAFQTKWLREHFEKEVRDILESDSFRARPYFNHAKVAGAIDRFFRGEGDNSFFIWQLVNVELWLRAFIH
jgi:asparagine synthase (glutamine-hydrolysing)